MTKEEADDLKAHAESLIDEASVVTTGHVSLVNRDTLTEALTRDLGAAADKAEIDTDRLAKVEAQTRVLADAVIAIADTGPSIAVGPAVEAVKAEMKPETTLPPALIPGKYFKGRANE